MASAPHVKLASRLDSIDFVRGLAMVVMALDHARDFLSDARFDPEDLHKTNPALFATRWVTHFCAPTFVLLAGTGAYLQTARGKTPAELSRFLWTRGLWLVVLELTAVHFGWGFDVGYHVFALQVIWALGLSMIVLAALVRLPLAATVGIGAAMVLLHDLLDGVKASAFGALAPLWMFLHEQNGFPIGGGHVVFVVYPLVPWIGVMALGWGLGAIVVGDPARRRRTLATLGAAACALFVVLRAIGVYGDKAPFTPQGSFAMSVVAFLDCSKYPPSLEYLSMTLGPVLLLLAALDGFSAERAPLAKPVVVFGRVPLFYYLLHLPVLHLVAIALSYARYHAWMPQVVFAGPFAPMPDGYGYSLPVVYAVWAAVVVGLYPACAWFAGVKRRRRDLRFLSYL